MTNEGTIDPRLQRYLRELRWALASLPEADRNDIVAEAESHLLDRMERGDDLEDAIAALGAATSYAQPFVESHRATAALMTGNVTDLLPALAERILRSFGATVGLLAIAALWAPSIVLLGTASVKVFHPEIAGFWVSDRVCFLGTIDDPSSAREMLGMWIFPMAFLSVPLSWWLTRIVAAMTLRRTHRKS